MCVCVCVEQMQKNEWCWNPAPNYWTKTWWKYDRWWIFCTYIALRLFAFANWLSACSFTHWPTHSLSPNMERSAIVQDVQHFNLARMEVHLKLTANTYKWRQKHFHSVRFDINPKTVDDFFLSSVCSLFPSFKHNFHRWFSIL